MYGEHKFELVPRPDGKPGTQLLHTEEFTGCAAKLFELINGTHLHIQNALLCDATRSYPRTSTCAPTPLPPPPLPGGGRRAHRRLHGGGAGDAPRQGFVAMNEALKARCEKA